MAKKVSTLALILVVLLVPGMLSAQDRLPEDNGLATYHTAPRYRASEEHPLRILAYAVHPVGWLAREVITRPLSYFAASSAWRRSLFGFREPYSHRQPECFSADSSTPDCRSFPPYNYDSVEADIEEEPQVVTEVERQVYFPDVNFDFDVRRLNDLGKGRARQVAQLLQRSEGVHVVLEGHADYIGSDAYNEKLGMDRAEAVRQELVANGVAPERLSTVTFGKSKPIFEEQEDWARAVNRRVEVHLDEGTAAPAAEAAVEEAPAE